MIRISEVSLMAVFQSTLTSRPVQKPAIESRVPLPVTRMSPHPEICRLLSLTGQQESLPVTAVLAPARLPGRLGHPREAQLVVSVTLLVAGLRLQY